MMRIIFILAVIAFSCYWLWKHGFFNKVRDFVLRVKEWIKKRKDVDKEAEEVENEFVNKEDD